MMDAMKFRTEIQPLNHAGLISHTDSIMLLGSCFSDNIGRLLATRLFNTCINPFGPLYNAASINAAVQRIISGRSYTETDLCQSENGQWFCFDCHTKMNRSSATCLAENLNHELAVANAFINKASTVCLTLGTAWIYRLASTGNIVANCHKLPANKFIRQRQTVEEAYVSLNDTVSSLKAINPDVRIIVTVSPIRHMADGMHGNQISKATLLLACEQLAAKHGNVIYFPSYEIMMDDLRSYRFYATDMKHPSDVAIEYIYQIFAQSFFSKTTSDICSKALSLTKRLEHKHITTDEKSRKLFEAETLKLASGLEKTYPELTPVLKQILQQ